MPGAKFAIGDQVVKINNPTEKGTVVEVKPFRRGLQTYRIRYSNSVETELEYDLKIVIDNNNPFELLKNRIFSNYIDFQKKNTSVKIRNTSNNTISSLKASRTIFRPYQYKPLLKFLNSDKRRLFIADEVGLGKTIEAGHILMELIGRNEMSSCIIICPKALMSKWKNELKNRFNLAFKIYNNKEDVVSDIEYRKNDLRGIINYEKFREKKADSDEESNKSKQKVNLVELIEEKNIKFDVVVCDESHRLRNPTQTSKGIRKIVRVAGGVLFLTATPIMTETKNLFNQLKLLDNETYWNYSVFENQDRLNRPIIKALSQLNKNRTFKEIALELENNIISIEYLNKKEYNTETKDNYSFETSVSEFLKEDELYLKVIHDLNNYENTAENRVKIQHELSLLNTLSTILTRTRKKDVTTDWTNAIRKPKPINIGLTQEEQDIHEEVIDEYIENNNSENMILGLIQVKRQLSSSLFGYLGKKYDKNPYVDSYDSKYEELKEVIDEVVIENDKKLIVFAFFKTTLKYLRQKLEADGIRCLMISGDIDERNEVIEHFRIDDSIPILLSSEVGSEGVDLQFCDSIVNYDLPWNPMIVEQRIGRIHRFGQNSPFVNIYTLITHNSIEKDIYERLLRRIGIFHSSIGDLEPILTDNDGNDLLKGLDKTLYSIDLTDEEKKSKLDDIAKAIEQRKMDVDELQSGLDDSITNDIYFQNEINRINDNFKYVAEKEIKNYLISLFNNKLTTFKLMEAGDSKHKIIIPKNEKTSLIKFLYAYPPDENDYDNLILHRTFVNQIRDINEIEITFNQETAYENKNLTYVNTYHPLILSAKKFFDNNKINHLTFQFSLSSDLGFHPGSYILGVYTILITNKSIDKKTNKEILFPLLFDINSQTIIDNDDYADKILGYAQQYAAANNEELTIDQAIIEDTESEFTIMISDKCKSIEESEKTKLQSQAQRRLKQEKLYYEFRIRQIEGEIEDLIAETENDMSERAKKKRSIIPAKEGLISKLQEELNYKEKQYQSLNTSTKTELISLSYINII